MLKVKYHVKMKALQVEQKSERKILKPQIY